MCDAILPACRTPSSDIALIRVFAVKFFVVRKGVLRHEHRWKACRQDNYGTPRQHRSKNSRSGFNSYLLFSLKVQLRKNGECESSGQGTVNAMFADKYHVCFFIRAVDRKIPSSILNSFGYRVSQLRSCRIPSDYLHCAVVCRVKTPVITFI